MSDRNYWTPTDDALQWARAYLEPIQSAGVRLSQHENKGAARIGLRIARYTDLSVARLAMLLDGLNAKQRAAVGILPAILHGHSEHLPGYLNTKASIFGVKGFRLNDMLERCGRLALSKELSQVIQPIDRPLIESVFLASAVGTIGQRSDAVVKVYIAANVRGLSEAALKQFRSRLDDITKWYQYANLCLEITLLDPVWTARGEFGEVLGDRAQGAILLDRFYRESFLLCGAVPIFWCTAPATPQDQYEKAASMIQRVDFERDLFFVDLGSVNLPTPAVRRRAMLGLLNHRSSTPLRFLYDLVQLVYGSNTALSLADQLKLAVFKHGPRPEAVDIYLFEFDCAMVVLNHHQNWSGLNVLRDFVFAKVAMRANKLTYSQPAFMGELSIAESLVVKWGWSEALIRLTQHMDSLDREGYVEGQQRLNDFVIELYRTLSEAAKQKTGRFDDTELALLGRRVLAHFTQGSNKILPHFAHVIHESIHRNIVQITQLEGEGSQGQWQISAGQTMNEPGAMKEVWTGKNLLLGMTWVAASRIYRTNSTFSLKAPFLRTGSAFLEELLNSTTDLCSEVDPLSIGGERFVNQSRVLVGVIVLNFDAVDNPSDEQNTGRKHYLPSNWDILNYGRTQESRLRDVTLIGTDSWDNCILKRARGKDALPQVIKWFYSGRLYSHRKFQTPKVLAPDGREHRAGQDRVSQLLNKIDALFEQPLRLDECSSFLYEVGNRFQVLQKRGDRLHCFDTGDLSRALRAATPSHLPINTIEVDLLAPSLAMLNHLRQRGARDIEVEVFVLWHKGPLRSEIIVMDSSSRIYRLEMNSKRFDPSLVATLRRIIHILKDRAQDMRTLRKLLKVYEAKDGGGGQTGWQLADDTVRALRQVGAQPPQAVQITVGGDFSEGRSGLYFEVGEKRFAAETSGRRFVLECVLAVLEKISKSKDTSFRIERSDVEFAQKGSTTGSDAVRHLRLMDICQSQLYRAVTHLKSGGKNVLNSVNPFSGGGLRE